MPSWTLVKVSVRLALILMTLSLFLCKDVSSREGMRSVPLGLPIPFVVLDARGYPPSSYPRCVRFGDPKRHRTRLKPLPALVDLLVLTLALIASARLLGLGHASKKGRIERR